MGMSSSGGGPPKAVASAINVTPLIDVLLVLLIIFLVVMPVMMKVETLQVPRTLEPDQAPEPGASQLTLKVGNDLSVGFNDGSSELYTPIPALDIARILRPRLDALRPGLDKVVFVEFEDDVPWTEVVSTMDTVRSLGTDASHDEVKVALKVKPDAP